MKKSNLIWGIGYTLAGVVCLVAALCTDTALDGLLFGFAGAGLGPGVLMIYKYVYWSAPKNQAEYADRMERERIELHDELYVKLRDKAGHYAYLLGILVICASMVVFSILGQLGIVENARLLVLYLCGYLIVQIAAGVVIMRHLRKKY